MRRPAFQWPAGSPPSVAAAAARLADEAEAAYARVAHLRATLNVDPLVLRRLVRGADLLDAALLSAAAVAARLEERYAGLLDRTRKTFGTAALIGTSLMLVLTVLIQLEAERMVGFFTTDPAVISVAALLTRERIECRPGEGASAPTSGSRRSRRSGC